LARRAVALERFVRPCAAAFFVTVRGVHDFARRVSARLALLALSVGLGACGEEGLLPTTIDPGADFEVANIVFDEGFYYCQVEPRLLFASSCGTGNPALGDGAGGCHQAVTGFTFLDYTPRVYETCTGIIPGGAIPTEARDNYRSAQVQMRRDVDSAPLFLRPQGIPTHPRKIFAADSDQAAVIREWSTRISTQ
jgi:hypothetical protein